MQVLQGETRKKSVKAAAAMGFRDVGSQQGALEKYVDDVFDRIDATPTMTYEESSDGFPSPPSPP